MVDLTRYLDGSAFDADFAYAPQIIAQSISRSEVLVQCAAGRHVLHVGFADHVPLIADRVRAGTWLHMQLCGVAKSCCGVDVNEQAVTLATSLGFDDVRVLDVMDDSALAALSARTVDLVMVPDVIEHLADAAAFLQRLAGAFAHAEFVISVPNALALRNGLAALVGEERINTDHRVWYSPYTLQKTLWDGGLEVTEVIACPVSRAGTIAGHWLRALMGTRPLWSDCLIAKARVRSHGS